MFANNANPSSVGQANRFESPNDPNENYDTVNNENSCDDFKLNELIISSPFKSVIDKCNRLGFGMEYVKPVFQKMYPNIDASDENLIIDRVIEYAMEKTLDVDGTDLAEIDQMQFPNATYSARPDSNTKNECLFEAQNYSASNPQQFKPIDQLNMGLKNMNVTRHHQTHSQSSIEAIAKAGNNLRPIIIDGDNLSYCADTETYVCARIKLAIDHFKNKRGHDQVFALLSPWVKEQCQDPKVLDELQKKGVLHVMPSKRTANKLICPDLHLVVLNFAIEKKAIIVSNSENFIKHDKDPRYKPIIKEKILMYAIIGGFFLPVEDPLGNNGPNLDDFLKFDTELKPCPYKNKCTYGAKCKYYHEKTNEQQLYKTAIQRVHAENKECVSEIDKLKQSQASKHLVASKQPDSKPLFATRMAAAPGYKANDGLIKRSIFSENKEFRSDMDRLKQSQVFKVPNKQPDSKSAFSMQNAYKQSSDGLKKRSVFDSDRQPINSSIWSYDFGNNGNSKPINDEQSWPKTPFDTEPTNLATLSSYQYPPNAEQESWSPFPLKSRHNQTQMNPVENPAFFSHMSNADQKSNSQFDDRNSNNSNETYDFFGI